MYYKIKNIMYQIDFRKKVLEVKKKFNLTIDEAAKRFDISRRSVIIQETHRTNNEKKFTPKKNRFRFS